MPQSSPDTPRPTDAPHPFNLPSADLILRTADLVDFRAHAPILALASPFFASMLALPQPAASSTSSAPGAGAEEGALPVVPVSEDSTTLELLLRLVYPISKPPAQMTDPQAMVPVLRAAAKYEMELPVDILSERLVAITPACPLQVWAASCPTGVEDVARQAAVALRASWTHSGTEDKEVLSFMDGLGDMAGISAADYLRLKRFLQADQSVIDEGHLALLTPPIGQEGCVPCIPSPAQFSTKLPLPDVTCRSFSRRGSQTVFHAHQVILCMYSPVLQARLAEQRDTALEVPLSTDSPMAAPLELDFHEKADVVSSLLKVCYDGEEGLPAGLALAPIAELLHACHKYQMARIARWVHAAWDRAAVHRPLEAYFVAINHGLNEYAKAAAKNVLTKPITDAYVEVMESAPALAYHRLLVYYDTCRQISRDRFVEVVERMPSYVYVHDQGWFYTTDIKSAIHKFASAAHGMSPEGGHKDALQKTLTQVVMSTDNTLRGSDLWKFLHPLMECITSVPNTVAAAIDDVQIELA